MKKEKPRGPQKGAAKKWSEWLKQQGEQPPSEELLKILNQDQKPKKTALSRDLIKDQER